MFNLTNILDKPAINRASEKLVREANELRKFDGKEYKY